MGEVVPYRGRLDRVPKPQRGTHEEIAWAVGVQLAGEERGLSRFLNIPDYQIRTQTSVRASEALYRLGHDMWAYWVRAGYEATRLTMGHPSARGRNA
jgi:hypothetical protein